MVVQRTINNLRERPKHERKAVATSIAIGIIIILFVGWAIIFFARIGSTPRDTTPADQISAATTSAPANAVTTNIYQSDEQIQQQNQFQYQTATNTVIQLGTTTN